MATGSGAGDRTLPGQGSRHTFGDSHGRSEAHSTLTFGSACSSWGAFGQSGTECDSTPAKWFPPGSKATAGFGLREQLCPLSQWPPREL